MEYQTLNILMHTTHIAVILTNCLFWAFKGWPRKLFLASFSLTIISWLGFGIYYGLGYCFLTDIHWQILRESGDTNLPPSYIHFILERWFEIYISRSKVDLMVGLVFGFLALIYIGFVAQAVKAKAICHQDKDSSTNS
ncbi:DUF2784 family protein [Pseudobacteriovorax antillogorgiicola]|uniref:DUF2784 domain-containing protein n=1 Tax=Pseudobacteriovorax antillogorgiicola TaxID=1513793 RepID=A0A1Y6CLK6_9BACT|nr:DUF2784 family protein [Pseudobacteriovorax antillogorgiicola]TCS45853.1 uncharacterized protein DUF2784 [Pseudobacteriovorax antillogorgiicola]SMF71407.1 Protein of Unknown function [Pseudobacteriovorax antillogorgiicola]